MAANCVEKARALEQCERDLDVAIERLVNLRLDATEQHDDVHVHPATAAAEEEEQRSVIGAVHVPSDGIDIDDDRAECIERLVEAMSRAENLGDARARAARLLEAFGASVAAACRAERDVALRQNGLLRRAVRVRHRLCTEKDAANRELQDRVRSLETDNYALLIYLKNAQPAEPQGGSITGRFHPEVF